MSNIEKMAEGYPYVQRVDNYYEVGLDPVTHIAISQKDMAFIASEYAKMTLIDKYPNRTGDDEMDIYVCPNCNADLGTIEQLDYEEHPVYCSHCAQKLNWNDPFNNGKIVSRKG